MEDRARKPALPKLPTLLADIQGRFSSLPATEGVDREQAVKAADFLYVLGRVVAAKQHLVVARTRDSVVRALHILERVLTAPARSLRPSMQPASLPQQLSVVASQPHSALHHLPAKDLALSAWALSKLRLVTGKAEVEGLAQAMAATGATSAALKAAGWREFSSLCYGLSRAGLVCSNEGACNLAQLFQRACQQLSSQSAHGVKAQSVSNLLLAAGIAGAEPQHLAPLVRNISKELSSGDNLEQYLAFT